MKLKKWTGSVFSLLVMVMSFTACKETKPVQTGKVISATATQTGQRNETDPPIATNPPTIKASSSPTNTPTDRTTEAPKESITKAPKTPHHTEHAEETHHSETEKNVDKETVNGIENMQPILETIALYMEEGYEYDPQNADCYYELCSMLGNNVAPEAYPKECSYKEGEIIIKKSALEEIVTAAFPANFSLTEIPKAYEDYIRYDKEKDVFCLQGTDKADMTGKIKSTRKEGTTYKVQVKLCTEDDSAQGGNYLFTLYANSNGGRYPYQVDTVKKD